MVSFYGRLRLSLPFCPAEIKGYARVPSGDFYALRKKRGRRPGRGPAGPEKDVAGLTLRTGSHVMERRRITVTMGTVTRRTFLY
jgi:hypothetical protein